MRSVLGMREADTNSGVAVNNWTHRLYPLSFSPPGKYPLAMQPLSFGVSRRSEKGCQVLLQ